MFYNGYLHTGKRLLLQQKVVAIDLWKTAANAEMTLEEDAGAGKRIVLDEDETEVIRRWADLSIQTAAVDQQHMLIYARCDLQEQMLRAKRLNRAATSRQSRAKKKSPKAADVSNVVEIDVWKREHSAADPFLTPAA